MQRHLLTLVLLSLGTVVSFGQDTETPHVTVSAGTERTQAATEKLVVTAKIADGLHIYAQSQPNPFLATKITASVSNGRLTGPFIADRQPLKFTHKQLNVALHEFEDTVRWTAQIEIEDPNAPVTIDGSVFAQACEEGRCFAPQTYSFTAILQPAAVTAATTPATAVNDGGELTKLTGAAGATGTTSSAQTTFSLESVKVQSQASGRSALIVIPLAFVAGFLLNFMPCVLPVVGLKLLSFVQQAKSDRKRVFLMNVAYTAGLQTVMLVLASLAVFAGLGWGQQFSSAGFTIVLSAVVFAFGLSFLGVWEIPLPGFVGASGNGAPQEGYAGAFSKGILSTLLATPCSGPFLGAALAWAVAQPGYVTFGVFLSVGFGMASPYLAIGAFPALVRFLPKPGDWMVRFKHIMGFVMLATVVYLLSFIPVATVVPTILLLLGLGFALWLVGETPFNAPRSAKFKTWSMASVLIAATALVSFGWLANVMQGRFERSAERYLATQVGNSDKPALARPTSDGSKAHIGWQTFSPELLEALVREGRPVFVDFTADWCLTCKANEASAIETAEFAKALRAANAVALRADKTQDNPKADALLRQLGNSAASIPFYAVFDPRNPSQPAVLDGVFTSPDAFVKALRLPTDNVAMR